MSYSIAKLKTDLTGILHGTNLDKVTGIDQLISRAGREVLLDVDPQETKRIQQLDLLFDEVFDVAVPTDLKGNKVIDIFPQSGQRNLRDNPRQVYNRIFDLSKGNQFGTDMFTILHNTGVKTMRIDNPNLPALVTLNDLGSIVSNGTWTVFDDATNLTTDNVIYAEGSSSLRFDLDGTGTNGGIEITLDSSIDLTNKEDISSLFNFIYFPTVSGVTSIGLRWGSSSSDYWEVISTVDASGNALTDLWNRIKSTWDSSTVEVGAPDASQIDYLRVDIIYDGVALSGLRADRITTQTGKPYNMEYYSKYIFSNDTGAFIESVDNDTNTVNLDTETFNLLLHKCAELAFQQQSDFGQRGGGNEMLLWENKYAKTLARYKGLYKSEIIKPSGSYYRMNKTGYNRRNK